MAFEDGSVINLFLESPTSYLKHNVLRFLLMVVFGTAVRHATANPNLIRRTGEKKLTQI